MRFHSTRALAAVAAVGALSAGAAGCGLQAGSGGSGVTVTVTRGFGRYAVADRSYRSLPGSVTPIRLLPRSARGEAGPGQTWSAFINGIAPASGPPPATVHGGDRVWWDLHPAGANPTAVVGSFPEPFLHGVGGKRLPTALECAADVGQACRRVSAALEAIGVPVAVQEPGTGSGTDSLALAVGTWADLRGEIVAALLEQGPATSGVYARFATSGTSLELLNAQGVVVRRLTNGGGLIAAIGQGSTPPTWLVTGTDPAGVSAAADALTAARLHDRYALAISARADFPLPTSSR